jgi:hypothetical protein
VPEYSSAIQTKIIALRALRAAGEDVQVFELVKVDWPSPTGAVFYTNQQIDENTAPHEAPPASPIEVRLMVEPGTFLTIDQSSSIGDEEVELRIWDGPDSNGENEGAFSDLLIQHGEGVKAILYEWYPQEELLLFKWEGHLKLEDDADVELVQITAANGTRSADAEIPNRPKGTYCRAIFGGLMETRAEAEANPECDYDLQLPDGTIGVVDPLTSEPYTSCPRASTADCTARGVDPLRHLSHQTILITVTGTQSSGGPTFSTTEDNATNLKKPVRVCMGERRIYGMPSVAIQRHPVTSNPAHGFFEANYEGPEGPIEGWQFIRATVGGRTINADPVHLSTNRGFLGQPAISLPVTTHGYSGTSLIRYNFGWINPADVDQNDATIDANCRGLCDIRFYYDIAAGDGLLGHYYRRYDFREIFAIAADADINFESTTAPPYAGLPQSFWSVIWTGTITIAEEKTYTFYLTHDDGVKLIIDGTTVINDAGLGEDSGNIDLAPGAYDIEIQFKQHTGPWYCIFEWESTSITREVVPTSVLSHPAYTNAFAGFRTDNRAWQIARMLCDKRWGYGKDYDALNMDSFRESAAFIAEYVNFIDSDDNEFPHYRGVSNVDLQAKKVQQQIEDMCLAGELSRPFLFDGKIHVIPLRALTEEELDDCLVFSDEGTTETRNIIWDGNKSTLRHSRKSSLDLYNRVELTYDGVQNEFLETTAPPVEDEPAQLAAGRVQGDNTKKVNTLKESVLGVSFENQAVKLAWRFLDLGKFDEGGLQNNLRVKFRTWFMDALTVHPFKVIKVVNARLFAKFGFEYFRIIEMRRLGNLEVEIVAQAYNVEYMDAFCAPAEPAPSPSGDTTSFTAEMESVEPDTITLVDGIINIPIG